MIHRILFSFLFVVSIIFNIAQAYASTEPLLTIRFNNTNVEYEDPLDRAVTMAKRIKPDVFFDIIAIAPDTQDRSYNKALKREIDFHARKIADQLRSLGIGDEMIRTSFQQNKFLKNNEIQLFVQ